MIAIDTNVLVRLFINDDAAQARRASALFDEYADQDDSLWIADIVLIELVWALDRSYGRSREEIVKALRALAGNADRKSTRLNSSHVLRSRMPSSA